MTPEKLKALIKQGEGYHLEFKQSIPSKASDLAEEICAFANAAGGILLIGVDDKGTITGVELDNTGKSRLHNILNTIDPRLEVTITEVGVNGKIVLCLECQPGTKKPYTVSGSIIVRNGPNSEKIITAQSMREFFQQSDSIFFDEAVCKDFKYPDDFNSALFKELLTVAGIGSALSEQTILENLKLIVQTQQLKNGGVLLFAKDPQQFYEQAIIRCVLFKGTNKTIILDNKVFIGDLVLQYKGALDYLRQKLNLNYIINDGGPRKEVLEIPEAAFREALINALCHRNYYEKGAVTAVEIFDDRVEISNPGGLVQSIARNEFGTRSLSRNPLIFGIFQRIDLVEKVGSGINRMRTEMQMAGLPAPVFSLEGMFTVRFYRPVEFEQWLTHWKDKLSITQVSILQHIHANNKITKQTLAMLVQLSPSGLDLSIDKLKELGILKREGARKSGSWKIIKTPA